MRNHEVHKQVQAIGDLIAETQHAAKDDLELQSHWARYLCVLVAGLLENALRELYSDFCRSTASQSVADFSAAALARYRNPKAGTFVKVSRAFKREWASSLEAFLNDDGRKEAIDSIMAQRNQIAHGKSSGITVARVADYFQKVVTVVDFIEKQCNGSAKKK